MDEYLLTMMQEPSPCDKCPFRSAETGWADINCKDHETACEQFKLYTDGERWRGFPRWPLYSIYKEIFTDVD